MSPAYRALSPRFRDGSITAAHVAEFARANGKPLSAQEERELDEALAELKAEAAAESAAERFLASLRALRLPTD